jgi:ribosomal protein L11 methyltransferase
LASVPALDLRFAPGPGAGALQDFLYAELDAFEPIAIQEHESGDGWRVFFRAGADRDAARAALVSEFGAALLELSPIEVDDDDWARRSQSGIKAVRVGRIVVAPPWDVPDGDIVIIIDPSMGFGTGHHETTRLCLRLLQDIDLKDRRAIDVGTGSGVLAIAAWRLGAREAVAIDNDPDALANARENIARNGGGDAIVVLERDLSDLSLTPADVVMANLTGAVLQRYAAALAALVAPHGHLIVSGFSPSELSDVVAAFRIVHGPEGPRRKRVPAYKELREGDWAAALIG